MNYPIKNYIVFAICLLAESVHQGKFYYSQYRYRSGKKRHYLI
jgi:hypothetical protein